MVPAVPLGHPEDLAGAVEVMRGELVVIVDESLAPVVDDRSRRAGLGVYRDEAKQLVPALIVEERKSARVWLPPQLDRLHPRVREEIVGDRNLFLRPDIEEMRAP